MENQHIYTHTIEAIRKEAQYVLNFVSNPTFEPGISILLELFGKDAINYSTLRNMQFLVYLKCEGCKPNKLLITDSSVTTIFHPATNLFAEFTTVISYNNFVKNIAEKAYYTNTDFKIGSADCTIFQVVFCDKPQKLVFTIETDKPIYAMIDFLSMMIGIKVAKYYKCTKTNQILYCCDPEKCENKLFCTDLYNPNRGCTPESRLRDSELAKKYLIKTNMVFPSFTAIQEWFKNVERTVNTSHRDMIQDIQLMKVNTYYRSQGSNIYYTLVPINLNTQSDTDRELNMTYDISKVVVPEIKIEKSKKTHNDLYQLKALKWIQANLPEDGELTKDYHARYVAATGDKTSATCGFNQAVDSLKCYYITGHDRHWRKYS
jgi:hypothetical protein